MFGAEAARLGSQVTRALVSRPLLAAGEEAIFHCDPHAGNLMLAPDGRLAVLDWSLVSRLTEEERAAMTQLLLAMLVLDQRRIVELVERLGPPGGVDRAALANVAAGALQRYRSGEFPGFHLLVALLDGAVAEAGLRASVEMTLFRKAIHTLEGVVGELSSQPFDVDQ